jgi:hypothetical protein
MSHSWPIQVSALDFRSIISQPVLPIRLGGELKLGS